MQALYTGIATAKGGREGHVRSDDGILDIDLKIPKGMGGPGGAGSNPEQLFAAGYAACFESAVAFVARRDKINLKDVTLTVQVTLNKTGESQFDLTVELHGSFPGVAKADAEKLMQAAHQVCPYSRATRGNVPVKLVMD
ncbi:MAG TPA: organic hydroperoxide resistance protein [Gammaproteobacteria bacterium]|jgi:Ohr subfamily peroxiredoxin